MDLKEFAKLAVKKDLQKSHNVMHGFFLGGASGQLLTARPIITSKLRPEQKAAAMILAGLAGGGLGAGVGRLLDKK